MTIYSIIPEERIFEHAYKETPNYGMVQMNGIELQVEWIGPTQAKIVRLYSANPADYMNPSYYPGTIISMQPVFSAR